MWRGAYRREASWMTCTGPGNHKEPVRGRRRSSIRLEGREEQRDAVESQHYGTWAFLNQQETYCEFFLLAFRGKQSTDFSSVELIPNFGSQYL